MTPEERKQEKREYSKAYYYLCKDHDVCPFCGKKSTKGMGVLCPECKESNRKSKQRWYENLSPERKKQEIQKTPCVKKPSVIHGERLGFVHIAAAFAKMKVL